MKASVRCRPFALGAMFAVAAVVPVGPGLLFGASPARADEDLGRVQHIIILMQENHSFDNYFGALAYASGSPYHSGPCRDHDHTCVDGLASTRDDAGTLTCFNTNPDSDTSR